MCSNGVWKAAHTASGAATSPYPYNEWMHVAGVYDGSELRLYANGTLVASEAYSGTISDSRNEDIVINPACVGFGKFFPPDRPIG